MSTELIHDRGRGPELVGTRITVYNLVPYFLDPATTEQHIADVHGLTCEQVAAARAYVLNHVDTVLAEHLRIEERISQGNPPELIERTKRTHKRLLEFRAWLTERERVVERHHVKAPKNEGHSAPDSAFPTFQEWLANREATSTGEL